ncbi:MAG: DUF1800 domain-containing protein [Armatimonadota bacterium]|nr:DUF1800 domain-containing protein [bacterium]MDW8320570.1 DUF1800 domain-containing protein [Armatimonadota bacterium]
MKLTRRECLHLALMTGAGALVGCQPVLRRAMAPPPLVTGLPIRQSLAAEVRWLNRVTFGATLTEINQLAEMGRVAYLEQQLHPNEMGEQWLVRLRLRGFDIFQVAPAELGDLPVPEVLRQLQQHALLRAVYSRYQLHERMVDFWRDHFNVYARKGVCAYYLPQYERDVLRKHALGKFPDLLKATARSPAMLLYLDNYRNRRGVPNENYARELLELHTLGVHGGYTQQDVQEVARCFTGWTVEERFLRARGTFRFDPSLHDYGEKRVLTRHIPAGGDMDDAERVLQVLAMHPSTAKHLCRKLCVHFMGHAPASFVRRLSEVYLSTGGDISEVLRELLLSEELLQAPPAFKRPFDYMVSALRALYALTDGDRPLQEHLQKMGQPLYQWPLPDGYPHGENAWKGTLLARWNFAIALCANNIRGTRIDLPALIGKPPVTEALLQTVFCLPPDALSLRPLRERLQGTPAQQAALILASPQFQWR